MKFENIEKIEKITVSAMESTKDSDSDYIVRSTASMTVNRLLKNTIKEYGLENVLDSVYRDILKETNDPVDSIGVWVKYDGKKYGTAARLTMLEDMEKFSDEDVSPVFELFKLMSPAEGPED